MIDFMAKRYVSRGIGEVEFLVVSGVTPALLYELSIMR